MSFFEKIKNSIYDPGFYKSLIQKPLGEAMKYYLLLALLISFFRLVFLIFPISSEISSTINTLNENLISRFPSSLKITIHHGQLSINQPQPYTYKLCFDNNQCKNIIIDTQKPDVESYLKQKNLLMLLTRDTAYIKEARQTRMYSLSDIDNFTLDQQVVRNVAKKISSWTPFLTPIAIIGVGILLYIGFLFKLIYILFLALILWLLAKKFAPGMNYGQAYKVGLHIITLGVFVALLLDVTSWYLHLYPFPFMETFFAIMLFIINFNTAGTRVSNSTETIKKPVKEQRSNSKKKLK